MSDNSQQTPPRGTRRVQPASPPPMRLPEEPTPMPRATGQTAPVRPFDPRLDARPDARTTGSYATAPGSQAQPGRPAPRPGRKRKRTDRSRSGFYLPVWSVLAMLVIVFAITVGIVGAIIALGGNDAAPNAPQIVIVTAVPSDTPLAGFTAVPVSTGAPPAQLGAPTSDAPAPVFAPTSDAPAPVFALEGPTLPPVILSPTPLVIAVGVTVVTTDDANVRGNPGTNADLLFVASTGDVFRVVGGPQQAEVANTTGTWWQVQDPADPNRSGWIFEELLSVQTPPAQ